jgi:16S rRNA G966 N2-methylase RsmD
LRPAADENREKIFDIITSGIDKALAKLGGIQ